MERPIRDFLRPHPARSPLAVVPPPAPDDPRKRMLLSVRSSRARLSSQCAPHAASRSGRSANILAETHQSVDAASSFVEDCLLLARQLQTLEAFAEQVYGHFLWPTRPLRVNRHPSPCLKTGWRVPRACGCRNQ